MTDRALRKQIIKGCNNAEARAELVRRSPRTAANAIQLYRQFMASLKDIESVNRAHELERCVAESKPTVLAVQSPNGIGFREDTQQQNNRSFRNRRNPRGGARQENWTGQEGGEGRAQATSPKVPLFSDQSTDCPRCGGTHKEIYCPFRKAKCFSCGGMGHTRRMCPTGDKAQIANPKQRRGKGGPRGQSSRVNFIAKTEAALATVREQTSGEAHSLENTDYIFQLVQGRP